jgi:PGAP1-like protein
MSQTELRALAALGFDELRLASGGISHMHRAIAVRAFRASGPGGAIPRAVHDGVTRAVYAGIGAGTRALGRAAEAAVLARARAGQPGQPGQPLRELSTTPRGSAVIAAIAGLRGDALESEASPLAQPMAVRVGGAPVPLEPEALAAAFPEATPRVVVFLHGLMETEFSWGGRGTYGTRLARDLGITPVYVRYNSGRRLEENGHSLSELMERLVEAWPLEVESIALVGHSMGGLVARCACHCASEDGAAWVGRLGQSVSLGTPHMGAPLEQAVHRLGAGLGALPETRALANFFDRRSAGIRDLREGYGEVPLCDGVKHCFVTATITRSDRHPLGRLIGDTLVLTPSASGRCRTRRLAFDEELGMHVGGAHHFALLNHPAVYERLRDWLS